MFVCLCNGFTERQVRACLDKGAKSVSGVYRCLGPAQCGKCIGHVREMVACARTEASPQNAGCATHLPLAAAANPA